MKRSVRLLSIEDSDDDDLLVRRELRRGGIEVVAHRRVDTLVDLQDALTRQTWDLCVCDFNLPTFDALRALPMIAARGLDLPTLVVTGTVDDEIASAVFNAGARDMISKVKLGRLVPAVERELDARAARVAHGEVATRLRETQERFAALMRHLPALVFLKDGDGRYVEVNDRVLSFLGRTAADVLGKTGSDVFGSEAGERSRIAVRRARAGAVVETVERLRDAGGEERDFTMLRFSIGEGFPLTAGVGFDITDRLRAEEAVRASEERFRTVTEAAADVILTIDSTGHVVYANVAATRMFGMDRETLCSRKISELIAPEGLEAHRARLADVTHGDTIGPVPGVSVVDMLAADGAVVPVELSLGTWTLGGERFVTGVLRDLRERHALEAQLRQAQKMKAVGQLAGGISHDFNNILGVISAYAELIGEDLPANASSREGVVEIMAAVGRGATLVQQLLTFSRQQPARAFVLELDDVVRGIEKMLRRVIGAVATCALDLGADGVRVLADRGQLEQVLINLAVNARDASPGGHILIATRQAEGQAVLLVRDDGTGMDEATRLRIFEPFFTTKGPGRGTGLGLSTVYAIVAHAGGRIEVTSAVGAGTTIEILLPSTDAPASLPAAVPPTTQVWTAPAMETLPSRRCDTVVVVDDDPAIAAGAARALRRAGYRVLEFERAAHALAVVRALGGAVSVVVTDGEMPDMGGFALFRALRAEGFAVPVVIASGTWGWELEAAAGDVPDGLPKPYGGQDLVAKVAAMLERARGGRRTDG